MTTEDDFHAALDANPDDWQTRCVLADFLEERGDERAEGCRALGVLRLRPVLDERDRKTVWFRASTVTSSSWPKSCHLPDDWLGVLQGKTFHHWLNFDSRRAAENAAAIAFAQLPAERRAELLARVRA